MHFGRWSIVLLCEGTLMMLPIPTLTSRPLLLPFLLSLLVAWLFAWTETRPIGASPQAATRLQYVQLGLW